ncbi:glutamine-hydrolyzing carbamoyl-phosphate synthase small subunit [Candidatus Uhrbacteria bacterium]|nr:glutamine-hydrolyzing carbamoyl-phosphate synthase small subunit [Candidatus Uhrbacteria bacterium]
MVGKQSGQKKNRIHKKQSLSQKKNPLSDFFFYSNADLRDDAAYPFHPAEIVLEDNTAFHGVLSSWASDPVRGEIVFTTGMTGYVQTLTDPSYTGQCIVFTYPLIGNYGVPKKSDWESKKIHVQAVIVSSACIQYSHQDSITSLIEWLRGNSIPLFLCADTRALTQYIRMKGSPLGVIRHKGQGDRSLIEFYDPNKENLLQKVSLKKPQIIGNGKKTVVVVDCGVKENSIRELLSRDLRLIRVPYDYDYTKEEANGVFLSNGPGDPALAVRSVEILKKFMQQRKPIFGICLGSQLLALAASASTYKLPFGHRGQNQPCIETATQRLTVTSQNHGYAIDETTLPSQWSVSFRNLNDKSVEGIAHNSLPFFAVQFHPEACPGPTDTRYLFDRFVDLL